MELERINETGSHHGDPTLTHEELDACVAVVKAVEERLNKPPATGVVVSLEQQAQLKNRTWLPTDVLELLELLPREISNEQVFRTCANMISWIRVARRERYSKLDNKPDWLPTVPDLLKSRLFWRLRSGKNPLPYPPPTCFSCPWYELIEDVRPHWVYDCYVHKPGEVGLWGRHPHPVANLGNTSFRILEWADKEQTVPSLVGYDSSYMDDKIHYFFRCYQGPQEVGAYDPKTQTAFRKTITGWWLQYLPELTA